MRMSSTSTSARRRKPQQERAAHRRSQILRAAEDLLVAVGFDAMTMTAVAEQAGASIGTVYDYFPDKKTLCVALLSEYGQEVEVHWEPLWQRARSMTQAEFAEQFIENMLQFAHQHPAYLPLLGISLGYARDDASRHKIRKSVAIALQARRPKLSDEDAFVAARVMLQTVKAMMTLYKEGNAKEKKQFTAEFTKLLKLYLADLPGQ